MKNVALASVLLLSGCVPYSGQQSIESFVHEEITESTYHYRPSPIALASQRAIEQHFSFRDQWNVIEQAMSIPQDMNTLNYTMERRIPEHLLQARISISNSSVQYQSTLDHQTLGDVQIRVRFGHAPAQNNALTDMTTMSSRPAGCIHTSSAHQLDSSFHRLYYHTILAVASIETSRHMMERVRLERDLFRRYAILEHEMYRDCFR